MVSSVQQLLAVLSDGEFHSGEELGAVLGVSRTAVWKHLQKLEELELGLEKVKGKGYCISGGLELLDKQVISEGLAEEVKQAVADIELHHSTGSTNDCVRESLQQGRKPGVVVLAEQQTAGRGRLGKQWVSPFARNLYLSTSWTFEQGAAALEGLSLAVGVAVRRAMLKSGVPDVQLKWPNDILFERNKLGGILLEMIGDPAGFCQVIVGIGVNVAMPQSQAESIDQQWIDVERAAGAKVSRNAVATALINELMPMLQGFHQGGFARYREEWEASDAFRGEEVRLITPSREMVGVADGVSDSGAIRLKIAGEPYYFNGGEISLRRTQ